MESMRLSFMLICIVAGGCGAETPLYSNYTKYSDSNPHPMEQSVPMDPMDPNEPIQNDRVVVEFTQLSDPEVTLAPDQIPEFSFETVVRSGELVIEEVNMYLIALLPGPETSMWLGTLVDPAELWASDAETVTQFEPWVPLYVTNEGIPWNWISEAASPDALHNTGFPGIPVFIGETVRITFSLPGYENPVRRTSFMLCPAVRWRNIHEPHLESVFPLFPETENSQTGCSGTIFHTP